MAKEIARYIDIPDGLEVDLDGRFVRIKGPKGELSRRLWHRGIDIRREDSTLVVTTTIDRKQQKAMVGTLSAHIANMIKGVRQGFEYRMKVVYSHFPIQLKATKEELIISNFLGGRKPRSARISEGSSVELARDEVIIRGIDKESVGQTMANIEQATRVRGFDIRIFQDGIYLVERR